MGTGLTEVGLGKVVGDGGLEVFGVVVEEGSGMMGDFAASAVIGVGADDG